MFKNHLKIAVRQMLSHKGYTAINALGLSVGFACCLIIFLFVRDEYTFDSFHENADRLFRLVKMEHRPDGVRIHDGMSMPVAPAIEADVPMVRHATRVLNGGATAIVDDRRFSEDVLFTDAGFFDMFTFPLLSGDPKTALAEPGNVVVTTRTAKRLFGRTDVVGESLLLQIGTEPAEFQITGVAEETPANSSIRFAIVTRFENHPFYADDHDNPGSFNHTVYIELAEQANVTDAATLVQSSVRRTLAGLVSHLEDLTGGNPVEGGALQTELQPVRDVHLDTRISTGRASNPLISWILGVVALIVLASAVINFVNLSIGRAADRTREIGIRKVSGADRMQLIRQFWVESAIVCLLSLVLGLVLAKIALPEFNAFLRRELTLNLGSNVALWAGVVFLFLATTFFAGGYPALFMSRFHPTRVLNGGGKSGGSSRLRSALIVVQFSFAILFVTGMFTMTRQLQYLRDADTGFTREQVVTIPISTSQQDERFVEAYKARIQTVPGVIAVTAASNTLGIGPGGGRATSIVTFTNGDIDIPAHILRIDPDYLETLDIDLSWGRALTDSEGDQRFVLINEKLASMLASPLAEVSQLSGFELGDETPEIAGVVKDFNFEALRNPIDPIVMFTAPEAPFMKMFVRIQPNRVRETLAELQNHWRELAPDRPFSSSFLDEDVDRQYTQETKQI